MTDRLVETFPEGGGIRELIRILSLHREHPARQVEQAIAQALTHGCTHLDGVSLFLRQIQRPDSPPADLDLSKRQGLMHLAELGQQPVDLAQYDQLRLEPSA